MRWCVGTTELPATCSTSRRVSDPDFHLKCVLTLVEHDVLWSVSVAVEDVKRQRPSLRVPGVLPKAAITPI